MRLINTITLKLEEFFSDIPDYCILSHRWEGEEVTFQDMQSGRCVTMRGYSKVTGCCTQALKDNWNWAWIDSCCIDKTSSAELSEAINSMFTWYERAQVCYAYLSDVPFLDRAEDHFLENSEFRQSKWFTRGWTLQELLAPNMVVFYDQFWVEIGTKLRMTGVLRSILGFTDRAHLLNFRSASVAQKMSWASRRETTRIEDQAYSLLGIFGVNMPPLYGEGVNAFLRLQLEIVRLSDDESIFAWKSVEEDECGLLASSPSQFMHSGSITRWNSEHSHPFSMTNKGLQMKLNLVNTGPGGYLAPLNCGTENHQVGISLRRVTTDNYVRIHSDMAPEMSETSLRMLQHYPQVNSQVIHVRQRQVPPMAENIFDVENTSLSEHGFFAERFSVKPRRAFNELWDDREFPNPETGIGYRLFLQGGEDGRLRLENAADGSILDLNFMSFGGHVGIDLMIQPPGQEMVWVRTWGLDRVSRPLPSGRSVSAVLRKTGTGAGIQKYLVEVDVHLDGGLPWPDPDYPS